MSCCTGVQPGIAQPARKDLANEREDNFIQLYWTGILACNLSQEILVREERLARRVYSASF